MLRVDTVTLVNLVSETRDVPEFIGKNCKADLIAPALVQILQNPQAQEHAMRTTMERWDKVIWLWLIVQRKLSWLGFNLG